MERKDELRRAFAKELALKQFGRHRPLTAAEKARLARAKKRETPLEEMRMRRSALLVAHPKDRAVYGVDDEQAKARLTAMRAALPRLEAACESWGERSNKESETKMMEAVVRELEFVMWHCNIYLAFVGPGANVRHGPPCLLPPSFPGCACTSRSAPVNCTCGLPSPPGAPPEPPWPQLASTCQ